MIDVLSLKPLIIYIKASENNIGGFLNLQEIDSIIQGTPADFQRGQSTIVYYDNFKTKIIIQNMNVDEFYTQLREAIDNFHDPSSKIKNENYHIANLTKDDINAVSNFLRKAKGEVDDIEKEHQIKYQTFDSSFK